MTEPTSPLLDVRGLSIEFGANRSPLRAVTDVSVHVCAGETLGLVGESGSGKSVTALSILRLLPPTARVTTGQILFRGRDVLTLGERELAGVRGAGVAMVFQEPQAALNPVFTVGEQLEEALRVHGLATRATSRARAVDWLSAVRVPDPDLRADDYPHQLSGGLQQRVMIALALAGRPALVIADEPTTALDVTVQAQVLDLLREQQAAAGLALLLITHDLGVVASMADRVAVMYAGRIVEQGPTTRVLENPRHPYTRALLASVPDPGRRGRLAAIEGVVPPLDRLPPGCAFAPRCGEVRPACRVDVPGPSTMGPAHTVCCHRARGIVEGPEP